MSRFLQVLPVLNARRTPLSVTLAVCAAGLSMFGTVAASYAEHDRTTIQPRPLLASNFSVLNSTNAVVVNVTGVYETRDSGRHWRNITPPTLSRQPVLLSHVRGVYTFARRTIWLTLFGDSRTAFMLASRDGGSTWHEARLPDNATAVQGTLAFTSGRNGRVLGALPGARNGVGLMVTANAGASWRRIATVPFLGPVSWSASEGIGVSPTHQGGSQLYRTTDRGVVWRRVFLPRIAGSISTIDRVQFLTPSVVFAAGVSHPAGRSSGEPILAVSRDSGLHWRSLTPPRTSRVVSSAQVRFAVSGASSLVYYIGTSRYFSDDMGRHWSITPVRLPHGYKLITVDVVTKTVSWGVAAGPARGNLYPNYVVRSSDGGATWSLAGI
jgi:photosystem II stability/assembly factor-like uncharacterized protein